MKSDARVLNSTFVRSRWRVLDYFELTKPELTFLSVLTALCGYYLALDGMFDGWLFFHAALGTALVGGGAGALNQYVERRFDAMMKRTERRPLPAGRVTPAEVLVFGVTLAIVGIVQLTVFTNVLTGSLAALTFLLYLFVYTPLKRVTPWATLVGAIPGALPPMMGWTAVRGEINAEAWILFLILFCWQMPHFLSLAWMYRKDYARAGFRMLTVDDPLGKKTSRQIILFCSALVPASVALGGLGVAGATYIAGAFVLGMLFLLPGIAFARYSGTDDARAMVQATTSSRRLFFASLMYLPALMLLLALDKL